MSEATPTTNGSPKISPGRHTVLLAHGGERSRQVQDEAPTTRAGRVVAKVSVGPLFVVLFSWAICRRLFGSR